jgi:orotate phosphoribosyltransferase
VAEQLNLPFIYVRPEKKSHGLGNQIEGRPEAGQRIAVVEDLISTGGSSLKAVESLRRANIEVPGMAAIFTYQLPQSKQNFHDSQCPLVCLSNFHALIEEAVQQNYITKSEAQTIQEWHRKQK